MKKVSNEQGVSFQASPAPSRSHISRQCSFSPDKIVVTTWTKTCGWPFGWGNIDTRKILVLVWGNISAKQIRKISLQATLLTVVILKVVWFPGIPVGVPWKWYEDDEDDSGDKGVGDDNDNDKDDDGDDDNDCMLVYLIGLPVAIQMNFPSSPKSLPLVQKCCRFQLFERFKVLPVRICIKFTVFFFFSIATFFSIGQIDDKPASLS